VAERTRGMGRGLAAILSTRPAEADAEFRNVPVELISPNPQQPRRTFEEEPLVALAESLKDRGVL
jgi:ParB family transcriptional regulator, chromosome partitioning protein